MLLAIQNRFGSQVERLVGLDTDPVAVQLCREALPEAEISVVDALLEDVPGDYDLCLGNPPYISTGLRGSTIVSAERQKALRGKFPASAQYKINTYPLFVERGLNLLRDGGVLGYVLPDSFLTGRFFHRLRQLLLQYSILEITLIQEDFWKHGRVGQTVILFVRKGAPPVGHRVAVRMCHRLSQVADAPVIFQSAADLIWGPFDRFRLLADPSAASVVRCFESAPNLRPLGDLVRPYSGLIGRGGQQSLFRSSHPQATGPWGRLIRSGREIDRYSLTWAGGEVLLDGALVKSGGKRSYYEGPKLLLRQTADSLRVVYDDQGFYCLNNIHLLVPRRAGVNLFYLLGLLNSTSVNRFYRATAMEEGRLYAQVDLDLLASLPVPLAAPELQDEVGILAQRRQAAAPLEAAALDTEIDQLVAGIYGMEH